MVNEMNKLYLRGIAGHAFYNLSEVLVQMLLFRPTPNDLIYKKNIKYGAENLQYFNTYMRKDTAEKKRPLLIYIHGGSWVSGITEMRNAYISQWALKGFNTAAISYTYSPEKIFPQQLKEIFSAIDYIADNADDLKFDLNNIVLAGESAGGYFVNFVAAALTDINCIKRLGIDLKNADKIKVRAIVTLSGCFDLARLSDKQYPQASYPDLEMMYSTFLGKNAAEARKILQSDEGAIYSPQTNKDFPPVFMVWGDKDILRYESFDLAKELSKYNIQHRLYKADGIIGMHAWSIVPLFKKTRECFEATFDFVNQFIKTI